MRLRCAILSFCASIAAFPTIAGATGAPPQGRLSDTIVPKAYRIDLTILPDEPRFSGHVEIDVGVKAKSPSIWINGRDLHVTSATARVAGRTIPARYTQVDPLGTAKLDFAQPIPAGTVTLAFDYDADFHDSPSGLYRLKVDGKWHVWSQFEAIDARAAFPGFDQPGFKTPFAVTITSKAGDLAVSNAPEREVVQAGDGRERHVFAVTEPLPTYLTTFVTGPFVASSAVLPPGAQRASPLPLRVVAPASGHDRMSFALEATAPIVRYLEDYFGSPFPYPKLDQIASPTFPGAMENAGAVIYDDQILLLDDRAGIGQLRDFGQTVSHELAHQWFGDLVTPDWWSDIWLNESFANWMGYRIANRWRPELKLGTAAITQAFAAMDLDALSAGRPVHQPIATDGEIMSAFDPITYGKGGQVIAMIAGYMGDDRFRDGVRLHLKRHAHGTATTDDFFRSLADVAHDPRITASLRSFVDQQGVPLVTFQRDGDRLTLTQAPYRLLGATPVRRSWIIPVCFTVAGERRCVLMDRAKLSVRVDGDGPVMPNAGGNGYYRFSLDEADWNGLIAGAGALPEGEALAVTDSLWAAFVAGKVPASLLVAEAKAVATNAASTAATDPGARFRSLAKRGLVGPERLVAYRTMVRNLYWPKLAQIGFDVSAAAYANEDPERQRLRAQLVRLVGLDAADPAVQHPLAEAAKARLAGNKNAVDSSEMANAFAAYLAVGGLSAAQELVGRALDGNDGYFRAVVMDVVARSGDPGIGRWLLHQLDDPRLRVSERTRAVRLLMDDPATRDIGYAALLARFDDLAKGSFGGVADLMTMPQSFCSAEAATSIEQNLRPRAKKHNAGSVDLDRTIERVRSCGALKQAKGRELADAL